MAQTGAPWWAGALFSHVHILSENAWSGRRESNPVSTHPKRMYYRYTTARYFSDKIRTRATPFGPPGIGHELLSRFAPKYSQPRLAPTKRDAPAFNSGREQSSLLAHPSLRSGRRELNPVYIHPMDAYCRYTTARMIIPTPQPVSTKNARGFEH